MSELNGVTLIIVIMLSLFAVGATGGWCLEAVYRPIKHGQIVNPGFFSGPFLPLYGSGVLALFIFRFTMIDLGNTALEALVIFIGGAVLMTLIELVGGLIMVNHFHLRLWDYREEKWNYKGLICPKFSFYWGLCCLLFCKLLYPPLCDFVKQATNYYFILLVGFYYGIFFVDAAHSIDVLGKIKRRAAEIEEVINFEELKQTAKEYMASENKSAFRANIFQNTVVGEYLGKRHAEMEESKNSMIRKRDEMLEMIANNLSEEAWEKRFKEAAPEKLKERLEELVKEDIYPKDSRR